MPSCEFCGCKLSVDDFVTLIEPAFGIYLCGKQDCKDRVEEFIKDVEENA